MDKKKMRYVVYCRIHPDGDPVIQLYHRMIEILEKASSDWICKGVFVELPGMHSAIDKMNACKDTYDIILTAGVTRFKVPAPVLCGGGCVG